MPKIGIIGYGSFGSFLVRKLKHHAELIIYDPNQDVPKELLASLGDIGKCDYIILAIPVDSYRKILSELKKYITKNSVLVDISSVKTTPTAIIDEIFPNSKRVITHPLFGPQSAEKSLENHVMVMCPNVSESNSYQKIKLFAESLGLTVVEKTPEEHDQEMAFAQGLTFFVARVLLNMGIHDVSLRTPSFGKLLNLAELETHHSEDLFRTIQQANPYTQKIREDFIKASTGINDELSSKTTS